MEKDLEICGYRSSLSFLSEIASVTFSRSSGPWIALPWSDLARNLSISLQLYRISPSETLILCFLPMISERKWSQECRALPLFLGSVQSLRTIVKSEPRVCNFPERTNTLTLSSSSRVVLSLFLVVFIITQYSLRLCCDKNKGSIWGAKIIDKEDIDQLAATEFLQIKPQYALRRRTSPEDYPLEVILVLCQRFDPKSAFNLRLWAARD